VSEYGSVDRISRNFSGRCTQTGEECFERKSARQRRGLRSMFLELSENLLARIALSRQSQFLKEFGKSLVVAQSFQ